VLYVGPGTTDGVYIRAADQRQGDAAVEIRLTDDVHEVGSPDWSPNGTQLVYTAVLPGRSRGNSFAGIITLDTITGRAVGQSRLPLGPIPGAEKAAWSPVSNDIAIQAVESPGRHAIWIVRADGSNERRLVGFPTHTYSGMDWSADGRTIIYSAIAGDRMQLFSIPASGGTPTRLTSDDWNVLHPTVSPDGRYVAATRIRNHKEIRRMALGATQDTGRTRALREIDAARRRFETAIATSDNAAIANTYAKDAFFYPPQRHPIGGQEAIRRSVERPSRDYEIVHHVMEVDVRGDIAYEIGRWIQRSKDGATQRGSGGYLWIWKRQPDGAWAIWREVWNDGPPPPTP
jgi:ketosteroid isomerase-like protein